MNKSALKPTEIQKPTLKVYPNFDYLDAGILKDSRDILKQRPQDKGSNSKLTL